MSPLVLLVVGVLATLRLTRLVTTDTLLVGVRDWVRDRSMTEYVKHDMQGNVVESQSMMDPRSPWAWLFNLLTCDWCMSVWFGVAVSALLFHGYGLVRLVLIGLAFSAAAAGLLGKM